MNPEKIVDSFLKYLPEIAYDAMDDSVLWNNEFQRREVCKKMAVASLEKTIRELEQMRGENLYYLKEDSARVSLEERVKELFFLIKQIKKL